MPHKPTRRTAHTALAALALALSCAATAAPNDARGLDLGGATEPVTLARPDAEAVPVPRLNPLTMPLRLRSAQGRLRCWQHGLAIVDEPIHGDALAPSAAALATLRAPGGSMSLLSRDSVVCLVSPTDTTETSVVALVRPRGPAKPPPVQAVRGAGNQSQDVLP